VAANDTRWDLPPGLMNGLLFFAVVVVGSAYIIASKLSHFGAFAVTAVPVLIMIAYALVLGGVRLFQLRDDQSGDNLYYMGFLFTLTSLAVSLYQFSAAGSAEQIVQNFGIAIAHRRLRALRSASSSTRCGAIRSRSRPRRGWSLRKPRAG
jgi:hypothetical protein